MPFHPLLVPCLFLALFAMAAATATLENQQCPNNSNSNDCNNKAAVTVDLSGVPETAVWVLHYRAASASDPTKDWFVDDKAIEIHASIGGNDRLNKTFGTPDESPAIRGWLYDQHILEFWKAHPDGTVVNFAEGLETHRFRLQASRPKESKWITVDLPEMIRAREKFMAPDEHHIHVGASCLDTQEWIRYVPKNKPVFFTAQGLVMYLEEDSVRDWLQTLAKEFPSSTIIFDVVSKRLSQKSQSEEGWNLTPNYRVPKLPFGVNKDQALQLFRSWIPDAHVTEVRWPLEKNTGLFVRYIVPFLMRIPFVQNLQPGMVMKITFPPVFQTFDL